MDKGKRIEWIDICKAITVYLMVLAHVGIPKNVDIFIHSFHMPMFFLLSGYCFNEIKYNKVWVLIKSRFLSLIVPYMIFGAGLFVFWNVCLLALGQKEQMQPVASLLQSMFWVNTRAKPFGVVQWFLTALFIAEIIFWFILYIGQSKIKVVMIEIVVIGIIGCVYPQVFDFRLPWAIDSAMVATVFFGLGWIMKRIDMDKVYVYTKIEEKKCIITSILLMIVVTPLIFLNGEVNIRSIKYENGILFFVNAMIMMMVMILLSMVISSKTKIRKNAGYKKILLTGKHTLVVLLLNSTIIRMWEVAAGEKIAAELGKGMYLLNVIVAMIVLEISVVISVLIEKYIPFILGKSNKGQ